MFTNIPRLPFTASYAPQLYASSAREFRLPFGHQARRDYCVIRASSLWARLCSLQTACVYPSMDTHSLGLRNQLRSRIMMLHKTNTPCCTCPWNRAVFKLHHLCAVSPRALQCMNTHLVNTQHVEDASLYCGVSSGEVAAYAVVATTGPGSIAGLCVTKCIAHSVLDRFRVEILIIASGLKSTPSCFRGMLYHARYVSLFENRHVSLIC